MRDAWALDPAITFLNHGSFGACPKEVLAYQSRLRAQLEAEPVRFMVRELEPLLDEARRRTAAFVGAQPSDLVFVPNATTAVNTVLHSLALAPGDELLTLSHAYNACLNALRAVAERRGAAVVVAPLPLPVRSPDEVVAAVTRAVTPRTRLVLLDHVTSPTALVLPVERLVRDLEAKGIAVLLDGAHAPGQVPLDLDGLGASYATGNLHKWVCAPKGAAFLHVRRDRRPTVRPLVVSHGANSPRTDRSRFHLEFDWVGTVDPTAYLSVPKALDVLAAMDPDGWPGLMRRNREDALAARRLLLETLGSEPLAPESMLGAMAAVEVPHPPVDLQELLFHQHRVEVPVIPFEGRTLVRTSAQRHTTLDDVAVLARALRPYAKR